MLNDIKEVVFLGDGIRDIDRIYEKYPENRFFCVSGNCDFDITTPAVRLETFGNVKFFITHGNNYSVKDSLNSLFYAGAERGCKVLLFGHTHIPTIEFKEGITLLNPGSIGGKNTRNATYAIIDITEKGVCPNIIEL